MTEITSARGDVLHDGAGARVVFHRQYPDPIEDVWSAITEPERLERWIGTWTGEASVGATVDFRMTTEGDEAGVERVTILACKPPRHLALEWTVPEQQLWRVEVTLEEAVGGTALTFVHHMADASGFTDIGPGWQYYLDRLEVALVGGVMPEWDPYPAHGDHYRADAG